MPKYNQGKQTQPIELDAMEKIIAGPDFKAYSHRSFLAFLYLTGVRETEALNTRKEDYTKEVGFLTIKIPAMKHGLRDHLKLSLDMPFMDLVVEQVEKTKPNHRVWNFTGRTAQRIVKRSMGEKYYPHFLRLNRSVHFLDDPTTTIPEMQSWFGWRSVATINSYLGYGQRHLDKQAERLKQRI